MKNRLSRNITSSCSKGPWRLFKFCISQEEHESVSKARKVVESLRLRLGSPGPCPAHLPVGGTPCSSELLCLQRFSPASPSRPSLPMPLPSARPGLSCPAPLCDFWLDHSRLLDWPGCLSHHLSPPGSPSSQTFPLGFAVSTISRCGLFVCH